MERNARTVIAMLKDGDRFYKATDAKKEVYTKVPGDVKRTHFQTYGHFAVKDGANPKFPQAFKKDTAVVFLRSTIDHETV